MGMADITRPIEPFELTQGFGENPDDYKRFGLAGHNGWDFRTRFDDTPNGERDILCSWRMELYKLGDEGKDGYGKFFETVCQLYSTWKLTFGHCKAIQTFNTRFEKESMATSDNTGNSTGPHLHFTVKRIKVIDGQHQVLDYNNGYFGAVDPQEFFDELRKFKQEGGVINVPDLPQKMEILISDFEKIRDNSETLDKVDDFLGLPHNSKWGETEVKLDEIKNKPPVVIHDVPQTTTTTSPPTGTPTVEVPKPEEKKHVDIFVDLVKSIFGIK